MSTDKTLADVQPGGRVRLGDQLPPLPPLPYPNYPVSKTGLQNNAYTASQMTDYARAALSAQPSPGGQDALVTDAMVYAAEEAYANSKPDNLHESFRVAIAAALAARQPVGEPVKGAVLIDGTVHLVQKGEEMDWVRDRGANLLYVIDRSVRNG